MYIIYVSVLCNKINIETQYVYTYVLGGGRYWGEADANILGGGRYKIDHFHRAFSSASQLIFRKALLVHKTS